MSDDRSNRPPAAPPDRKAGYWSYRTAAWLSQGLPRLFAYWVGLRIADSMYRRDVAGRNAVTRNLTRILAWRGVSAEPEAVQGLVRQTYQHFGKYLVDFFRYTLKSRRDLQGKINVENLDYLRAAHAEGRGVILLTAHIGNWEMGGLILTLLGYPVTAVFKPFGQPALDRLFAEQRDRRGIRGIPLGDAARGVLQTLRAGGCAAILGDRDFTGHTRSVQLFGAPAPLPMGPVMLACRSRAPIVPVFALRQVDDRVRIQIFPPIRADDGADAAQARIVSVLQDVISAQPHQWYIFEDFWPEQPPAAGAGKGGA